MLLASPFFWHELHELLLHELNELRRVFLQQLVSHEFREFAGILLFAGGMAPLSFACVTHLYALSSIRQYGNSKSQLCNSL